VVIDRETTPKVITVVADSVIENQVGVESHHPYPVATRRAKLDFLSVFGNGALSFDGSADELTIADSADWDFGTGDFTLSVWWRPQQGAHEHDFFGNGFTVGFFYYVSAAGLITVYLVNVLKFNPSLSYVTGTWYHMELTRASATLRLFVNGTLFLASVASAENITGGTNALGVGRDPASSGISTQGLLDNAVVKKGLADHTATFNPPTEDFTFGATGNFGALLPLL
jgi:hypothetical protein